MTYPQTAEHPVSFANIDAAYVINPNLMADVCRQVVDLPLFSDMFKKSSTLHLPLAKVVTSVADPVHFFFGSRSGSYLVLRYVFDVKQN